MMDKVPNKKIVSVNFS